MVYGGEQKVQEGRGQMDLKEDRDRFERRDELQRGTNLVGWGGGGGRPII